MIQQAVQLGNTQDADGNYIFSGTASNTKPFIATTTNGNITAVNYKGGTEVAESDIGPNTTVSAQVLGSGTDGLFTNSSTGADLFNHMLALQADLVSGNTSAISSTDAPALNKDEDNVISQISANGVMQSALTAAGNIATAQSTNLTTQISGATSADLAQTLTDCPDSNRIRGGAGKRDEGSADFVGGFFGMSAHRHPVPDSETSIMNTESMQSTAENPTAVLDGDETDPGLNPNRAPAGRTKRPPCAGLWRPTPAIWTPLASSGCFEKSRGDFRRRSGPSAKYWGKGRMIYLRCGTASSVNWSRATAQPPACSLCRP